MTKAAEEPVYQQRLALSEYRADDRARSLSYGAKNVLDVLLGSVIALMATPVIMVLAVMLAIRLRQWPFFLHHRMGRGGRTITFPKLRTLPGSTPRYALKNGGKVIPADRFCSFLRHRHLDELPQLYLVPVLRLSLVGPRPKMPDRWEPTHPGYRDARQLVRQGCTGLWQVGRDSHHMVHERPEYDFSYLQYGSIRMDLWILWRTALLMVGGRPIDLDRLPRWVIGRGWVSEERIRAVGGARFLVSRARRAPEVTMLRIHKASGQALGAATQDMREE